MCQLWMPLLLYNMMHASRQSCRGHTDDNSIEFGYHEWKTLF